VRRAHVQREGHGPEGPAHTDGAELLNPEELIERVQVLQADLDQISDPRARQVAEDLVGAIVELYGEGMRRIVDTLETAGENAAPIRDAMADDGVIASLLLIHDLYPVPLDERVMEALDQVRPYLDSHGGGVELLDVSEGVARIRLEGSCKTCPASSATLELAVKQALDEVAPDLEGLIVEGLADSEPAPSTGFDLPVLQVSSNGDQEAASKTAQAQAAFNSSNGGAWHSLAEADSVAEGRIQSAEVGGATLAVARIDGTLLAFLDCCPSCSSPVAGGTLLGGVLACPECGASYELPRAGLATDGGTQLDPVPLLADSGGARVALPQTA
jgi:Fe-S cluster biogenesis protein NfuA/nitrite reductase/ring-hydroxylating ferredoxin subunit